MTKLDQPTHFSRRAILKAAGALVVSIGMPVGLDTMLAVRSAQAQGTRPPLTPDQLSSYIAVNGDGTVSAFFGKMDMGQGLITAISQMVAEELDVPFKAVKLFLGDTGTSVNQGGASGSTGIQNGGKQMRMAAAEARRVLVEMAAAHFGVPAERMTVTDGIVRVIPDASATDKAYAVGDNGKFISYADLIGGRYFNVELAWNKKLGNALYAPGKAKPKKPSEHKIVGQRIKRADIAPKVFCQQDFCTDIKVPGMLHGRMIRPAIAGAVPVKVDDASIKKYPRRPGGVAEGIPRRRCSEGMGCDQGRANAEGGMVGSQTAFPRSGRALRSHSQGARAQARRCQTGRQCRRCIQDRRQSHRSRIRMAVPVACQHGTGLRPGRN